MSAGAAEDQQRLGIVRALRRSGLGLEDLYVRYFALGGTAGLVELEAYLQDLMPLPVVQRDMLAHAVNERLAELAPAAVAPYSRTLRHGDPATGPLAALVAALDGARLAPPDDLATVAAAAGRALGVRLSLYLVDYAQEQLVPLSAVGGSAAGLGVDGSLAGRAFRQLEILSSDADGRPRLWLPLLDGGERLGVLEVEVEQAADTEDRVLREHLRWVAAQLGHLTTTLSEYGDALHRARLDRPRTAEAELVWSLLPPLAAGTTGFSVAGLVEPSSEVGGDVFDYALARSRVSLAVFDGMGHGMGAGLMAAATLAASRAARRQGHGVYEQAAAVDDVLGEQFENPLVTGVLADLDLSTGRLRYLAAGHPFPLLLRGGRVVKRLTGGRRTPFGVGGNLLTVGEEQLEPGDCLALHTDGLTEARDTQGRFFGEQRLVDLLEREVAAGRPPAESVRRLMRAVLSHQHGVLQDDATMLLAQWDSSEAESDALGT